MALPVQLVEYYHVQVLYLWITSSYKYYAFFHQPPSFLLYFHPIQSSEQRFAEVNIWTLSVITEGGGCVNSLSFPELIDWHCKQSWWVNAGVYPGLGDDQTVHVTCTCGLVEKFSSWKFPHNMSNDDQLYLYELVCGLAENLGSLFFSTIWAICKLYNLCA